MNAAFSVYLSLSLVCLSVSPAFLYACLSVSFSLSVCLFDCFSVYTYRVSVCIPCLSVCLYCLSVSSVCISVCLSVCLSALSLCLSILSLRYVCLSCLYACLVSRSVCFVSLSAVCLSCLSVCLSVSSSVFFRQFLCIYVSVYVSYVCSSSVCLPRLSVCLFCLSVCLAALSITTASLSVCQSFVACLSVCLIVFMSQRICIALSVSLSALSVCPSVCLPFLVSVCPPCLPCLLLSTPWKIHLNCNSLALATSHTWWPLLPRPSPRYLPACLAAQKFLLRNWIPGMLDQHERQSHVYLSIGQVGVCPRVPRLIVCVCVCVCTCCLSCL